MRALSELTRAAAERGGADVHLAPGLPPHARLDGALVALDDRPLAAEALVATLREAVGEAAWAAFERAGHLDRPFEDAGQRLRVRMFTDARGVGAVVRAVPEHPPKLESLGLPTEVASLVELDAGLVLVTGPADSGRATTLAALVDRLNQTRALHVVVLEGSPRCVHRSRRALISQLEVGAHVVDFADGLRAAHRLDPDVVAVGALPDAETCALALDLAARGTLVLAGFHAPDAERAVQRLIDLQPAPLQRATRGAIARSLEAVVAQRLVPRADGRGRCVAVELLLRTPALPRAIREGRPGAVRGALRAGRGLGARGFDDAMRRLLQRGAVTERCARRHGLAEVD